MSVLDNESEMEMEELVDDQADAIDDEYPDYEDAEGKYVDDEDYYAEEKQDMEGVQCNLQFLTYSFKISIYRNFHVGFA